MFVGWLNVGVVLLILPHSDLPGMILPLPVWWVGLEPNVSVLVLSPFVFANYSSLIICGSMADEGHA